MVYLLIMSIVMFTSSIIIFYLGYKNGTTNTILWTLFPLIRGIHWLIEYISDYYSEILDIQIPILDRFEVFTAIFSSFILLTTCLELNGVIRAPKGKIIGILVSSLTFFIIFTLDQDTFEKIDDITIFKGYFITSDPFRLFFGFIIPILSVIVLISTYLYYSYQANKKNIYFNPKFKKATEFLILMIIIFSIFEGFDYFEEQEEIEAIFIILRAITVAFFVIVPAIIIVSQDLGLLKFLVIERSGLPLFAYNFNIKSEISDETSLLTSGFLSAIMSFSEELSSKESDFLTIQSNHLYYIILKIKEKLFALQSILRNKNLEKQFYKTAKEINNHLENLKNLSDIDKKHLKEFISKDFLEFV